MCAHHGDRCETIHGPSKHENEKSTVGVRLAKRVHECLLSILLQLHALNRAGTKLEIEALCSMGPSYLTDSYLRRKLAPYANKAYFDIRV